MTLALLVALVVVQYAPASMREISTKYLSIQHDKKKSFCSGFKLLRKRPCHHSLFMDKYPLENIDYDEDKNLFVILCDHSPCRSTNTEIEFTLASLCLQDKIDKDDLNLLRPVSFYESVGNPNQLKALTPKYYNYSNGCR